MSASSNPTTYPSRARATARLTVTDDLPTPPFPDAIGYDPRSGREVDGRRLVLLGLSPGPVHQGRLLLGSHGACTYLDRGHSRDGSQPGVHVVVDLAAKGARRDGQSHLHVHAPCGVHDGTPHHPEIDDVVPELWIDHTSKSVEQSIGARDFAAHQVKTTGGPCGDPFRWIPRALRRSATGFRYPDETSQG